MNQISRGGQAIADEVEEVNKDCDLLFGNHIAAGSYETIAPQTHSSTGPWTIYGPTT